MCLSSCPPSNNIALFLGANLPAMMVLPPKSGMKRPRSAITNSSSGPQLKKAKRTRPTIQRSVEFSPNVSMRCFFPQDQQATGAEPSWFKKEEVEKFKFRAKALCKLHHVARKRSELGFVAPESIGDAVRCEIKGESLRGMEYLIDMPGGRTRRQVQEAAMQACAAEQQQQMIDHVLDCAASSSSEEQVKSDAMKMDSSKLAKAYGSKTREALRYAKSVAEEDAKIAAEILAEDLAPKCVQPLSIPALLCKPKVCSQRMIPKQVVNQQQMAANIIDSLFPGTMFRHRNIVSKQA